MALKRVHIGFTAPQFKMLEKLAAKLGLDKTNTIRYCVARVAEQEAISKDRAGRSATP
jgi:predicted transcriptional regulator